MVYRRVPFSQRCCLTSISAIFRKQHLNGSVPLRLAVLRFIPEPPGSSRFMDRDVPGENDVFLPKKTRKHPGAPRFIQVEPRQGHGSSRRLHGSPRFSGQFSTVHPGPCRRNPGDATVLPDSPRRSYGPSRFTTVHPGEVKMQYK